MLPREKVAAPNNAPQLDSSLERSMQGEQGDGIAIARIKPGHPPHNGRHERMHIALKKETTRPPCAKVCSSRYASIPSFGSSTPNGRTKPSA